MSAARKIHTLSFHLSGLAGEDVADDLIDAVEEFADGLAWPLEHPDAYKYREDEADEEVRCAIDLTIRATVAGSTIEADQRDFEAAMALIEHLRELSAGHGLAIEVDFDGDSVGSIDKGVFSESLREGLIEPWAAGRSA